MEENPNFTKEVMDNLLADVYVEDNIIAEIPAEDDIEQKLGKFTSGWKQLADFYGIEGLVGGDGDGNPEEAFKNVIASYFSERAVEAREDKGLTHNGAISVIEQDLIDSEKGGVVHLTEDNYNVSEASDAERAVKGQGDSYQSDNIADLVEETSLESMESDLRELHRIFGDIDVEYVWDEEDVYLTKMRPKHKLSQEEQTDFESYERLTPESIDEIYNCSIDNSEEYVVEMEFLGRENIMDRVGDLNKFIRENEENISGVSGNMPRVAHIPNNIESHFQIPYREMN